ncbi:alpha/beta fold hydrolase [Hugenholtzia roseola]|uniref:alpha/beta fold hydrolase n=1 Tax=Hugenholtzia roseola TaxID=1002 RepID=UPI0003FAC1E4|nr:alpha/beta hydrolase [Hugenholtzia roseola]
MELTIKSEKGFEYIDEGEGEVLLLLHGLFGAMSNWNQVVAHFSKSYRVLIPMMPIYTISIHKADLGGLVAFIEEFVKMKGLRDLTLVGNSLGGHVGLIYALKHKKQVHRLALTGSSGLFENGMGGSYPRRGSYDYIQEKVAYTFYDPAVATKELVDDVFEITNSNAKCLRMITIARSAQRHNMAKEVQQIDIPTLLVWGLNDTITPPLVAHEFNRLLPNSELRFIDRCGHAPMMEHPEIFNAYFEKFLQKHPLPTKSLTA